MKHTLYSKHKNPFSDPSSTFPFTAKLQFILIGVLSIVCRSIINYRTEWIPGIDGGYYALQVRSLIERGFLAFKDWPFVFYFDAILVRICMVLGFSNVDHLVMNCIKISDILILPTILFPIWLIYRMLSTVYSARFPKYLALYAAFSITPMMMIGDMLKNAFGLVFLAWFLYFVIKYFKEVEDRSSGWALIFLFLISITHFGTFVIASSIFIIFHLVYRSFYLHYIIGLCILALMVYLFSLYRPDRLAIAEQYTFFSGFSMISIGVSIFRSSLLIYTFILGFLFILKGKWDHELFLKHVVLGILIMIGLSFMSMVNMYNYLRIMMILYFFVIVLIIILLPLMNPIQTNILVVLIFISVFSGFSSISFKNDMLPSSQHADLELIGNKIDAKHSLICASREIAWWTAWHLRSKIKIVQGDLPDNSNKDSTLTYYVLVQNNPTRWGIKVNLKDPNIKGLPLHYANNSFSIYRFE